MHAIQKTVLYQESEKPYLRPVSTRDYTPDTVLEQELPHQLAEKVCHLKTSDTRAAVYLLLPIQRRVVFSIYDHYAHHYKFQERIKYTMLKLVRVCALQTM